MEIKLLVFPAENLKTEDPETEAIRKKIITLMMIITT
jgi:hypothetical protein